MVKSVVKFVADSCANALYYGVATGFLFGLIGLFFLVIGGDPTGLLSLGSFGVVLGVLMGLGQTVIHFAWRDAGTLRLSDHITADASRKDCIAAFVWAIEGATATDLQMLGVQLRDWHSERPEVTRITGLDALLNGRYPLPGGQTPIIESPTDGAAPFPVPSPEGRQVYVPEPWKYCPALVWSTNAASSEVMKSLKRAIPSSIGNVGYSME